MEKWFFGLGKEKEKTLYPSCTPSEDMQHLLPRNNKKNTHDFSKMWSRRDYDAATLELITTNCSKASPSQAASMIAPIDAGELWKAVKSLHNGKAPRPDRLPNGIYSAFFNEVKASLVTFLNGIMSGGDLPQGFTEATVRLIPKRKLEQSCRLAVNIIVE